MHQIVRINFVNYKFFPLLRGHIPLRHPLSPQTPKFCQSFNLGATSLKILDPQSVNDNSFHCSISPLKHTKNSPLLGYFSRWNPSLKTKLRTCCAALSSFRHFVSERSGWKGLSLGCVFEFLRYCLYNGVKLRMRSSAKIQMCMKAWILSLTWLTRSFQPIRQKMIKWTEQSARSSAQWVRDKVWMRIWWRHTEACRSAPPRTSNHFFSNLKIALANPCCVSNADWLALFQQFL